MREEKRTKRLQPIDFNASEIFALPREALNKMINSTITRMVEKNAEEGEVTLKISITMDETPDTFDLEDTDPSKKTPKFSAKVTRTIKDKFDLDAPIETKGHLLKGEDQNEWFVYDGDPQMTFDDLDISEF